MSKTIVLGLTGAFGSGCGETAKQLERNGYKVFSLSDIIKESFQNKGDSLEDKKRKDYQDEGDRLRKENGNDYLARVMYEKIEGEMENNNKIVIKSIRNPCEASFFNNNIMNFYLINIDAEIERRKNRVFQENVYDNEEDFIRDDKRDAGKGEPVYGQNIRKCVDISDIVINNNLDLPHLHSLIDKYKNIIENPRTASPSSVELNMGHAYRCSFNSTCLNRKVGAVIVKDEQIIASGWNDTPKNVHSCLYYGYCVRKKTLICERGTCNEKIYSVKESCICGTLLGSEQREMLSKHLDLCQAIHAEERAILQVAKMGGQPLSNSILYSTTFPCLLCAKKIIEVDIKEVVYIDPYPYSRSYEILNEADVELTKFEGVKSKSLDKLLDRDIIK